MQSTTQSFLEFKEIKQGVVILKSRALRGILMVSSINFDLKSEEEQNSIVYQFQSFLNSLDFSTQIIAQSRRLNITGYFDKLKELEAEQKNDLLRVQVAEYRKFVQGMVQKGVIMTKQFFVIVPYSLGETKGIKKSFGRAKSQAGHVTDEAFVRSRNQLYQRMEFVAIGLRRCGLTTVPLTTAEIIELLWSWHHPKEAEVGYYPEILPELVR